MSEKGSPETGNTFLKRLEGDGVWTWGLENGTLGIGISESRRGCIR